MVESLHRTPKALVQHLNLEGVPPPNAGALIIIIIIIIVIIIVIIRIRFWGFLIISIV